MAASPISAAGPDGVPAPAGGNTLPPRGKTLVVRADPKSGKLVRSVSSPAAPRKEISDLVNQTARKHDVDPLLVHSVIDVESGYNPNAISPKGAQGLMQLMPATAKMLGVRDSFDPGENIEAGVKYLKYLQDLYKDDRLALAAYNAGPAAVEKYRNIPPYRETQDYVNKVAKRYDAHKGAANAPVPVTPKADPTPETKEDQHPKLESFVDENGRLYLRTH